MAFLDNRMSLCFLLLNFIICVTCVQFALADQCKTTSSTGKQFVFGFIGGFQSMSDKYVHLHMTSSTNTTTNVRIVVPYINYDENRSFKNSVIVRINGTILHDKYEAPKQFKAVEVFSDSDISLLAMVPYSDATEGFMVLPTSALGTRYVAASYHPYLSYMNEILVIGTEPSTDVQINYTFNGKVVSNTVNIVAYETYQLSVNHDISGALITSNKHVAVVSGSAESKVPVNTGDYQALMEQLLPTKYWGYKYIVPPIYPHKSFIVKLFADDDTTTVDYYNATGHATEYMYRGDVLEKEFGSSPVVILSNKPIQVLQYNMDNERLDGDPFMTTSQSMSQFTDSYKLITTKYYTEPSTIVITIEKTKLPGLRLNETLVTNLQSIMMSVPEPFNNYVTIFANLTYGETYNVHHVESGVLFGASLYWGFSQIACGYPLEFTLKCNTDRPSSTSTPPTTSTTPTTPVTSPSLNVGTTTNVHHGNPQQHRNGTWCFQCQDMYSLANCDVVTRCSSDSQVCFVQRYKQSNSYYLYRSGCTDKHMCGTGNSGAECHECCESQFCNTHGCGDAGVNSFQGRGPLCFDCAYQSDGQLCHTVQLCATNQVCSIETHAWGSGLRHTKGCVNKLACDWRIGRSVHTRSTRLCSQCCSTDFCNEKCSQDNSPPIIG